MAAAEGLSKGERLRVFYERLRAAPAARTFEEAYQLVVDTLNGVENEFTSIPHDPTSWQSDGRLYPPEKDSVRQVPNAPTVKRFRSRGHNTFIADNGAIEGRTISESVEFSKLGHDGKGV